MPADTIARAKRVLCSLENLHDDIGADCRALDAMIKGYYAAGDDLSRERARRRLEAMLRAILDCLAAFASSRGRA